MWILTKLRKIATDNVFADYLNQAVAVVKAHRLPDKQTDVDCASLVEVVVI